MTLANFPSAWTNEEHRSLQDVVARFMADRWVPRAAEFRAAGRMGPDVWREAGANGLLCTSTPEAYGGGGGDFGHEAVILLEQARANLSGWGGGLHSAIVAPYLQAWVSEQQGKVMDECLQPFGGYGYMMEYPIAELYVDARVQRIYGGTNEIMKELASRSM